MIVIGSSLLIYTLSQGVVICVTSLVMALAQDHLEAYAVCYQKAVDRLNRVSRALLTSIVISDISMT